MTFTYIDGVFIGILILLTLIGAFRGFLRSILAFFGTVVKLIVSFLLCKPFALLLSNWTKIDDNLRVRFLIGLGLSDKFNVNLVGMGEVELTNHINASLSDASFPRILRGVFTNIFQITPEVIAGHETVTIADLVAISLAQFVMIAISFIVIFILIFIIIFIIKRLSKKVFERHRFLFKTDKILGAVVGLIGGLVTVMVLLSILSIFKNSDAFAGFFNTLDKSVLTKPISDFLFKIVDNYLDFGGSLVKTLQA